MTWKQFLAMWFFCGVHTALPRPDSPCLPRLFLFHHSDLIVRKTWISESLYRLAGAGAYTFACEVVKAKLDAVITRVVGFESSEWPLSARACVISSAPSFTILIASLASFKSFRRWKRRASWLKLTDRSACGLHHDALRAVAPQSLLGVVHLHWHQVSGAVYWCGSRPAAVDSPMPTCDRSFV